MFAYKAPSEHRRFHIHRIGSDMNLTRFQDMRIGLMRTPLPEYGLYLEYLPPQPDYLPPRDQQVLPIVLLNPH